MHEKVCSILSVSLFLSVSADLAKNVKLRSGDNGLSTVNDFVFTHVCDNFRNWRNRCLKGFPIYGSLEKQMWHLVDAFLQHEDLECNSI